MKNNNTEKKSKFTAFDEFAKTLTTENQMILNEGVAAILGAMNKIYETQPDDVDWLGMQRVLKDFIF